VRPLAFTFATAPAFAEAFVDFTPGAASDPLPAKALAQSDIKPGWIEVDAFAFGAGKPKIVPGESPLAKAAGPGSASTESLKITLPVSAEQEIFQFALTGKPIRVVRIRGFKRKDGAFVPVFDVKLNNVWITAEDWKGKGDKATTTVTLDYDSADGFKQTATSTPAPGSLPGGGVLPGGWNRVTNTQEISPTL
jgi:type VI protein secretion system component Hcp